MGLGVQDKLASLGINNADKLANLLTEKANAEAAGKMGYAQNKANMFNEKSQRVNNIAGAVGSFWGLGSAAKGAKGGGQS